MVFRIPAPRRQKPSWLCWTATAVLAQVLIPCPATIATAEPTAKLRLVQPCLNCSDFDVVPAGWEKPAFRLLLPEQITAEGKKIEQGGTFLGTP